MGVKPTSRLNARTSQFDPTRTHSLLCFLQVAQLLLVRETKPKIARVEYLQRDNCAYSPGSVQSVGPGEGQSSKVRRRPSPAASLPVNFLFWRTFCSGAALVPGAHCSHRRTISWQLSVMRTPVALPPILKRMEQRMPEHRRFTQTISLEESLPEEAKRLRKQAQGTPPGIERERLVRRARQLETASRMNEWLTSRGLQAPKQGQ